MTPHSARSRSADELRALCRLSWAWRRLRRVTKKPIRSAIVSISLRSSFRKGPSSAGGFSSRVVHGQRRRPRWPSTRIGAVRNQGVSCEAGASGSWSPLTLRRAAQTSGILPAGRQRLDELAGRPRRAAGSGRRGSRRRGRGSSAPWPAPGATRRAAGSVFLAAWACRRITFSSDRSRVPHGAASRAAVDLDPQRLLEAHVANVLGLGDAGLTVEPVPVDAATRRPVVRFVPTRRGSRPGS